MIRVLLFLIAVAIAALGMVWIADRPGEVAVTWLGYRIETSVTLVAAAIIVAVVAIILLWSLLSGLIRLPAAVRRRRLRRRELRAHSAIARGLVAIGAGDPKAAQKFAREARRLSSHDPLALLLEAQTAQFSGDRDAAEQAFRAMVQRQDTKLLGLHGLFVEAQRRKDAAAARSYAEQAAHADPSLGWAARAVLEFRCAEGDWAGALAALESNLKSGLVGKDTYKRQRAVLLTARALSRECDRDAARALVVEAAKLCPQLVPAAALAGRFLAENGERRKAARILEAGWAAEPHPDLAIAYAHLNPGDSARDRLTRMRTLARQAPQHIESALAVARAAIDAQEFAVARDSLAPFLAAPTQRVAALMAELEEAEHGDIGRARGWMARALHAARDPAWTADGFVSDKWMPLSPVTGHLDAFQWRVPLADLSPPGATIEHAETEPEASPEIAPAAAGGAETVATAHHGAPPLAAEPPSAPAAQPSPSAVAETAPARGIEVPEPAAAAASAPFAAVAVRHDGGRENGGQEPRAIEPVVPLARIPDDPGPEPEDDGKSASPRGGGWRSLFK